MLVTTCTGSAKPSDRKRSCQDGDVEETSEAFSGTLAGCGRCSACAVTKSSVCRHLQTTLSLAAPEGFCHLSHDQWHTVVRQKLSKVFLSSFLLCLSNFSLFHSNLYGIFPQSLQQAPLAVIEAADVDAVAGGTPVPEAVTSSLKSFVPS